MGASLLNHLSRPNVRKFGLQIHGEAVVQGLLLGLAQEVHHRPGSEAPVLQIGVAAGEEDEAAALPLGFFMIALNLYTYIDTVILGVMRSDAETGWYAAAYRVYEGLTYVPAVLSAVLTPRLSYLFAHDRAALRPQFLRALAAAAGLGLVLGGVALWLARPLMSLLFGSAYAPAAVPLQILAGGAVFVFSTWILHAAAIATNLDRRLLLTTGVGLGSNVVLNLVFIPRWGMAGAAWATVIAEAATVGLLFVQLQQRLPVAGPRP